MLLVLGPRRVPPIHCPTANTATSISVLTSVGFRQLEAGQYVEAVRRLHPDIVVGLADVVLGREPGVKRRSKMVDRTHAYTTHATEALYGSSRAAAAATSTAYFAPIPPLDNQLEMRFYWEELEGELRPRTGGLAFYAAASLATVPESLADQPRLLLTEPMSPQEILRSIALGADLMALPLLSACTDAGMALSFSFPAPRPDSDGDKPLPLPLACDMWAPVHATDESPLVAGCECHTCKTHHRAYIRHLLTAREMLAWTLLQIHNHHVLDMFFAAVRDSIGRGTFEQDICGFEAAYESGLPETTGQGPRWVSLIRLMCSENCFLFSFFSKIICPLLTLLSLRGYQLPASGPSQPKRAPKVFGRLDDAADKYAESVSSGATPDAGAESIEARGFAAKQLDSD